MLALVAQLLAAGAAPAGTARIAIVPDVQNYDTTIDAGDDAMRVRLLDLMVGDILDWKPDFVIQVGDLTDSTGGPDQMMNGWLDDDPNSKGAPNDAERTSRGWKVSIAQPRIRERVISSVGSSKRAFQPASAATSGWIVMGAS